MRYLLLSLLLGLMGPTLAQTKLIALKSHHGRAAAFSLDVPDNLGIHRHPAEIARMYERADSAATPDTLPPIAPPQDSLSTPDTLPMLPSDDNRPPPATLPVAPLPSSPAPAQPEAKPLPSSQPADSTQQTLLSPPCRTHPAARVATWLVVASLAGPGRTRVWRDRISASAHPVGMRHLLRKGLMLWVSLFVATWPFPYEVLPRWGAWTSPWFEPVNRLWWAALGELGLPSSGMHFLAIASDTTGAYLHLLTLLIISTFAAALWQRWHADEAEAWRWFRAGVAYYLALTLLRYGWDKVLGQQFPPPEPNLLYTPLGHLTPDLLYWSSVGSAPWYGVATGAVEVVAGLLLLWPRLRLPGALLTLGILVHVAAINFGFDISVKLYSLVLLGLTLLWLAPLFPILWRFACGHPAQLDLSPTLRLRTPRQVQRYAAGKSLLVSLLLLETIMPYLGHRPADLPLRGAYAVVRHWQAGDTLPDTHPQRLHRVYVHRRGHLVLERAGAQFRSLALRLDSVQRRLRLQEIAEGPAIWWQYREAHFVSPDSLQPMRLWGPLDGDSLHLTLRALPWRQLPLRRGGWSWTLGGSLKRLAADPPTDSAQAEGGRPRLMP